MQIYQSVNPYTSEAISAFECMTDAELNQSLLTLGEGYLRWSENSIEERVQRFLDLAKGLRAFKEKGAKLIAEEMGKPLSGGMAEIEKCAALAEYYAKIAPEFFTAFQSTQIHYQPTGVVLGIMPWNFPFWQVFRLVLPNLMMGNTLAIKHAPNVPRSALAIQAVMREAGVDSGCYQNLLITHAQVSTVIAHPMVSGVSLTGSARAGKAVAECAGKHLKKVVLELGGSDPFIVCEDASFDKAVTTAVKSRLNNSGQVCISAKRFFVHESLYPRFLTAMSEEMQQYVFGDPLDKEVTLGPLARPDLLENLTRQVQKSLEMGATLLCGGDTNPEKNYFAPTILANVTKEMPVMQEETFGPVAAVCAFSSDPQALAMANDTPFGLGASVWTHDPQKAAYFSKGLQAGAVFLNQLVSSELSLPFGGVKQSGFGRELGVEGLISFANIKTISGSV